MEEVVEVELEAATVARSTTSRRLPRPPRAPGRPCTSRSPRTPGWRGWRWSCGGASWSVGPPGSTTGRDTSISLACRGATGCASAPSSRSTNAAPARMIHAASIPKNSKWCASSQPSTWHYANAYMAPYADFLYIENKRVPLPQWVLEEMDKMPDLSYTDRYQRRNKEYISLGCDVLPLLKGRSPMQAYSDFMRSFRDTFKEYLGAIVTEVQVGMGPGGELRYPSCPTEKLNQPGTSSELGEFQCYDQFMQASLSAHAQILGIEEWGDGGPAGTDDTRQNPAETNFFRADGGCWNTPYG